MNDEKRDYLIKFAKFIIRKGKDMIERHSHSGIQTPCVEGEVLIASGESFVLGTIGTILPDRWSMYQQEFDRESDPEYLHYLRLKEKYEKL